MQAPDGMEPQVYTHTTNTRIGDVDRRYPVLLCKFSIRKGSRGVSKSNGSGGVVRDIKFLQPIQVYFERGAYE